jgi:hypothetical protein
MLVIGRYKPLYFLQWLFYVCLAFAFFSCVTAEKSGTDQAGAGTILFYNQTPFTVHLVRGSGRIDAATVAPNSTVTVSNIAGTEETYYPLFDIPLTADYSLPRLRPENPDFYYQVDNKKKQQEIEIKLPAGFNDASVYIVFTSRSKGGGVSLSRNQSSNRMTSINYQDSKSTINEGETLVFRENLLELQSLRINPLNISFGEISYQAGYVYSFVFDGNEVIQTDARPLVDVGKSSALEVIFAGDNLSVREQQQLITALTSGLERSQVPFRPLSAGEVSSLKGRVFYILQITLKTQVLPAQPPVNRELIRGDLYLSLVLNSKVLAVSETERFTEMNRTSLLQLASNFLLENQTFYEMLLTEKGY